MIDKIDNNQFLSAASSLIQNTKKALPDKDLEIKINADYSALIEKALSSSEDESEIIEKARKAIRSGELESLQNFQKAAENIITFGI